MPINANGRSVDGLFCLPLVFYVSVRPKAALAMFDVRHGYETVRRIEHGWLKKRDDPAPDSMQRFGTQLVFWTVIVLF